MLEDKDIDIQYTWSEDNPVYIMKKNNSEAYFSRHTERITEGELWELVDTGRDNIKNTIVTDDVSPVTRMNIPITHSLKLWMGNKIMLGS